MSQRKVNKKDWVVLTLLLSGMSILALVALWFGTSIGGGSMWMEHEGGDGPYEIPTGSAAKKSAPNSAKKTSSSTDPL